MEQLAWQLLESKKDIVAAEKVFAALANRAKLRSTSTSISEKDFESIQTHKMITTIITLFFSSSSSSSSTSSSPSSSTALTADQFRSLAAAVLEPRIPSCVLFGNPETEDELAKAYRTIQLFVHPDKGHVKTTDAFVKLSERKFECAEQVKEFQNYLKEEERKEQEKREEVMRQFADALNMKRNAENNNHHHHHNNGIVFPNSPFSSIPTGHNMFTLHHHQNQNQDPSSRNRGGITSPLSPNLVNHHHHQSSLKFLDEELINSESTLLASPSSLNNTTTISSGSYHLPPLQGRKRTTSNNNNNSNGGGASSSPMSSRNHHSPLQQQQQQQQHLHHQNSTTVQSSFAAPTSKPNPLERGKPFGRPPSATINNISNTSSTSKKFLDFASSPRRAGVATFSPHEKNKQKMKEKEFESLMKQLRQQKHQTGANMNGSFNKFLGELQHDHVEQRKEEDMINQKLQQKSKIANNNFSNNNNNHHYDEKDSDTMIELTMKALLSKLKTKNSNVKLTCSLSSTTKTSSEDDVVVDHHHDENNDEMSALNQQHHDEEEGDGGTDKDKKSCRDFVVHRLGQVLQGHLRSFGDEIIDFSNNTSKTVEDLLPDINNDVSERQQQQQQKRKQNDDQVPKDFQLFGSKFIPSPPSHLHHQQHNAGSRRQSMSNNTNQTSALINHQGVAISQHSKTSGIHAAFHVSSSANNNNNNSINASPRRPSVSVKR